MRTSLFTLIALSVIASGYANGGEPVSTVSFADFKSACSNPAQFHNQIAPSNIQITCRDVHTRWVMDQLVSVSLPDTRDITTSLMSDKYAVSAVTVPVNNEPASLGSPTYKQIVETVETSRMLSCSDVLSFKGSPSELCSSITASLIASNKEAVITTETGQKLNPWGKDPKQEPQQEPIKK